VLISEERFLTDISISNYFFKTGVLFVGNEFLGNANFFALAECPIYFFGNTVRGSFILQGKYENGIVLSNSLFEGGVFSANSTLNQIIAENAIFKKWVSFSGANIAHVTFDGSSFLSSLDFSGDMALNDNKPQTIGRANFRGVSFGGPVDFSNRKFLHSTQFSVQPETRKQTIFAQAPQFYNSELHQNTSFDSAVFNSPSSVDSSEARAYSTLRHAMSKVQANRDEHRFLALELDAERAFDKNATSILYRLYRMFSGYGFSLRRPIILLIVVPTLLAFLIYGVATALWNCEGLSSLQCGIDPSLFSRLLAFTLLHSLPPLGIDKLIDGNIHSLFADEQMRSVLPVIVFQKIATLGGWFFIALGLRNLFRMK